MTIVEERIAWCNELRALGFDAAHPNDGWVDRERLRVTLCYPQFDQGVRVGSKIMLGWPGDAHTWRAVEIIEIIHGALCSRDAYAFRDIPLPEHLAVAQRKREAELAEHAEQRRRQKIRAANRLTRRDWALAGLFVVLVGAAMIHPGLAVLLLGLCLLLVKRTSLAKIASRLCMIITGHDFAEDWYAVRAGAVSPKEG